MNRSASTLIILGLIGASLIGCSSSQLSQREVDDLSALSLSSAVDGEIRAMEGEVDAFQESGDIESEGITRGLKALLSNARDSVQRNDLEASENMMRAFQHKVRAQRGKHIREAAADQLVDDAQQVIGLIDGSILPTRADLGISLVVTPDPVTVGHQLTYTLTLSNLGPDEATDIRAGLLVLGDVQHSSAAPECSSNATSGGLFYDCTVAELGVGDSTSLVLVVKPGTGGEILLAQADILDWSGAEDPNLANNLTQETAQVTSPAVTLLTAGRGHTCALDGDGAAFCWGRNDLGQLGDGSTTSRAEPMAVSGSLDFVQVSAGDRHTCGITRSGSAHCWGRNDYGQLGDGSRTLRSEPVAVSGGMTFKSISAATEHTCGIASDGTGYCWGRRTYGKLGDGGRDYGISAEPVPVHGAREFQSIATGFNHTCAVTVAGAAFCWGSRYSGVLGDGGGTFGSTGTPTAVAGGHSFESVSANNTHTCAVTRAGDAYCWGSRYHGKLGDGGYTYGATSTPVMVAGGLLFETVAAGLDHTCGVTTDGGGYCWGRNAHTQLGTGMSFASSSDVPLPVEGELDFVSIQVGTDHSCGVTGEGLGYCWGSNYSGALGDGTTTNRDRPTPILLNDF